MKAHLRYLRYVLLHKLYVFAAGVAIARTCGTPGVYRLGWIRWLWRLLIHDLSKFGRAEWTPYVHSFYADKAEAWIEKRRLVHLRPDRGVLGEQATRIAADEWVAEDKRRRYRFNVAWLHHIHVNPHHWQHWILHEDSGKTLVLLPESRIIDEMIADWIGAGSKILARPTLAECVAETVKWYAANHQRMQLRDVARGRVEETLLLLSAKYGLVTAALQVRAAEQARASLVIPGR